MSAPFRKRRTLLRKVFTGAGLLCLAAVLMLNFARVQIGGRECDRQARIAREMVTMADFLVCFRKAHGRYPATSEQLQAKQWLPLIPHHWHQHYRYVPPSIDPVPAGTVLFFQRRPSWHFHGLAFGQLRVFCVIEEDGQPVQSWFCVPRNRYNGSLRKIFFWYFLFHPFTGPGEITPEEAQKYADYQAILKKLRGGKR